MMKGAKVGMGKGATMGTEAATWTSGIRSSTSMLARLSEVEDV